MIDIPGYEIKEKIGQGGMAKVYRAIHNRLEREVALKIMSPEAAASELFQKNFLIEGRIVAKLNHPNIINIFDIDSQNGHFYMSMELLNKGSLKQRLANGQLPVSNALRITAQIAAALSYSHKRGYIHRDIKPANILFREDGSAVLTDFGIAKMQGSTGDLTQMGYISGTPYYMSPEQSTGDNKIDNRADIYSLGIMFYEMLTGTKPFTGSNTVAITYEQVHGPIPTLTGENSIFQSIIDKALAKNKEDRFDDIEDFSKELYLASDSDAETLLMRPAITHESTIAKKKITWPWLIAFLLIGLGVISGTYYYSKSTEEKRIQEQQQQLEQREKQQKVEEEQRKANHSLVLAKLEAEKVKREAELISQKAKIAIENKKIITEKINNHLSIANIQDQKRRVFNHSNWTEGCKTYLEDVDGPYDPYDSSEWHYQTVLSIDKDNEAAYSSMLKIDNRKMVEFNDCDKYQRTKQKDPLNDLFND